LFFKNAMSVCTAPKKATGLIDVTGALLLGHTCTHKDKLHPLTLTYIGTVAQKQRAYLAGLLSASHTHTHTHTHSMKL
jgi:hypothetical protein